MSETDAEWEKIRNETEDEWYCGNCNVFFPSSTFESGPHAWHQILNTLKRIPKAKSK